MSIDKKPVPLRLKSRRYARHRSELYVSQVGITSPSSGHFPEEEEARGGMMSSSGSGGSTTRQSRIHQRASLHHMVSECGNGEKVQR